MSKKSRRVKLVDKYEEALDKLDTLSEDASDDIADYVYWLREQIQKKRQVIQSQAAEIDELRHGHEPTKAVHFRIAPDRPLSSCGEPIVDKVLRYSLIIAHVTCTECKENQ